MAPCPATAAGLSAARRCWRCSIVWRKVPRHDSACILTQIDDWERLADRWGGEAAEESGAALWRTDLYRVEAGRPRRPAGRRAFRRRSAPDRVAASRARGRRSRPACARCWANPSASAARRCVLTASAGHPARGLMRVSGDVAEATLAAAEAAPDRGASQTGRMPCAPTRPACCVSARRRPIWWARSEAALEGGEIRPWFQPQVRTLTCELTGFEGAGAVAPPGTRRSQPLGLPAGGGRCRPDGRIGPDDPVARARRTPPVGSRRSACAFGLGEFLRRGRVAQPRPRRPCPAGKVEPGSASNPARLTVEILETVAASSGR